MGIADIPVQAIDLDIPLHIPGLASTDSYYNLSESGSHGKKPKKKKKKSSKKTEIPSSDDEEVGPNMFVSRNIDLPEGASISDLDRSDTDDGNDPHKALGNIILDDINELQQPPVATKEKKSKKKLKDVEKSPELVEHKAA